MPPVNLTPTHKNLVKASQSRNPRAVLEQAMMTHRDFFGQYGPIPNGGLHPTLLEMADITSATSGILNKVFGGRALWAQLNTSSQFYQMLPKVTFGKNPYGWRAKTAFASSGRGGVSEGTVPTAVVGTYVEVAPTIVEHATQMRVSGMQQDLAGGPDDAYGLLADVVQELGVEHAKEFERALTLDIDTLSGTSMESIDRMTASSANQAAIGWTVGDEDFAGVDRSANTWADAVQKLGSANAFSLRTVDQLLRDQRKNGGFPTVFATGWDTWAAWSDLVEPRGRFEIGGALPSQANVGGADVPAGRDIGTFVSSYQGLPIVPSDQAKADTDELSRLYSLDITNPEGLDKPRAGIDILRPTQMFMAGEKSGTSPQSISFLGDSALAVTRHQLGCRFFKAQGQYRDFVEP